MSKREKIFTGVYYGTHLCSGKIQWERQYGVYPGGSLSLSLSLIIGWRSIFRADFPIGIIKGARVADFCCTSLLSACIFGWDWSFDISQESSCYATISSESRWCNYGAIFSFSRDAAASSLRGAVLMRLFCCWWWCAQSKSGFGCIEKLLPCVHTNSKKLFVGVCEKARI